MVIICDHRDECSGDICPWRHAKQNSGEMINVRCSAIGRNVSVLNVNSLPKDNPNRQFKMLKIPTQPLERKKNGF